MGGYPQARRLCAAAIWSFLLAILLADAQQAKSSGLFPPKATVVLLVGVPGDVESESNYREQVQGLLELAADSREVDEVFLLCDGPEAVEAPDPGRVFLPSKEGAISAKPKSGSTNKPPPITVLKADRDVFAGLGQTLAEGTNPLVVIAWGHGGRQGRTPVLHVRGPRITAADFKEFAGKARAVDSRWVLMFRGSGSFAGELAGERRQIISSEGQTMFSDDPIGMPLLLKIAKEKPALPFPALAEELGAATGEWYKERNLARTEEPTFWAGKDQPRHLVPVEAEENAKEPMKEEEPKLQAKYGIGETQNVVAVLTSNLPPVWNEIKRVDAKQYPEADAVILRRRVSYTLATSPAIASEQEEFVQVLTPEGKHYGDFDVGFSPPEEDLSFLDCEVLQSDGKLVRLDPDAVRDTHEQPVGDYHHGQRKFFSLPGVGPGAVLHVRYKSTWKKFPLPHVSLEIPVGQDIATLDATLQVSIPKDSAFHFALDQVSTADPAIKQTTYGTTYTWRFENLRPEQREILVSPGHRSRLLISTFPDWAAFSEWYARITKLADEVTPEITAKSKELTKNAKDDRKKALALYNYVTRLRYVAVPLGVNSYRPHAAGNVLQNQFGDCKDKANLYNALLREAGIEADLVLVPRFSQAREEIPGLSFNHAISRLTLGGETAWVDTTDDVCRFGMLPPGDPGRKVLVIDGHADSLTQLPAPLPREHVLKVHGELDCSAGLDALSATLTATAIGYPDYELRNAAREAKAHAFSLPLLSAKLRPVAGSFALDTQDSTSVAALNEDFTWHASGAFVGLYARAGDAGVLRAPFWLPKEWDLALHKRSAALYLNLGYPLILEEEFVFASPATAKPAGLPGVKENVTSPLRWRIEWTKLGDGKLAARLRVELAAGELSAADTPVLQKQLRELMAALAGGASFPAP